MGFRCGIVGLPNVGKSTLFNALTETAAAQAANYPFCTIEPNEGIVSVPDGRLERITRYIKPKAVIPSALKLVDIAGIVKGASEGQGLGNKFLSHIREVDAIVQVVRCFEDADIHHVSGSVDPLRDIEVILTELVLADLGSIGKQKDRLAKTARSGDKHAKAEIAVIEKLEPHLNAGKPALTCELNDDEKAIAKGFFMLSNKPNIFACNVKEGDLAALAKGDRSGPVGERVKQVEDYCASHFGAEAVVISAQIESELIDLEPADQQEFLKDLGVEESGVGKLIRAVYHLLGLRTYFTTGEKETRAWTIHAGDKAPAAAGVIHSDFERGFIAAETMAFEDLAALGSEAKCREAGKLRVEGKEYTVQDGDVMEFRFNV